MKRPLAVRLDQSLVDAITIQAKKEHRTLSGQAGYLLELGMKADAARNCGQARETAEALAGATAQPDEIEARR